MNRNMRQRLIGVVSALVFVNASANATDWSSLGGSAVVPAGETWTATESDMSAVNALSSITVNGTLVFSGCTTCPKADLLHGQGTVKKTGTETWNLSVNQSDFDGNFRICGGKIVVTATSAFGNTSSGCNGAVYVESGATLKIASTDVKFVCRPIHIAGPGYGVMAEDKALCIDTARTGAIGLLYLDDDATLYVRKDSNYNHYFVVNASNGQPRGNLFDPSVVNLGNHTLTKTGAMEWCFLGPQYLGGTIVNAEGDVCIREAANLGDWTDGPFRFQNAATLKFYNNPPVVRRPLEVENKTLTVRYVSNQSGDGSMPLLRTNCCNWAGDVALNGASAHLLVAPQTATASISSAPDKAHDVQLSFFGDVSGEGKVTVGASDRSGFGRIVFGGHNSYLGNTYVYGGASSRLCAYWHDSIPDYSKLTVDRGYVAVRPGMALASDGVTETERWPLQKILDLRSSATFLNDAATAIDASDCTNGLFTVTAADLLENDTRHDLGFGSDGGTVRITTNPGDTLPITPCAFRGRLELQGGGIYQLVGSNAITSVSGVYSEGPCVSISGGAMVLQGLAPFYVGCRYSRGSGLPPSFGTVAISNATWTTTCSENPGVASSTGFNLGALYVGSHERGVLDLQKDAVVSNKLQVGGGSYQNGGGSDKGDGAVYVGDGAHLFVTGGGASYDCASSIGLGGYGYLELAPGGVIKCNDSSFHIGGRGRGVYHQYGGNFTHLASDLYFAPLNGGSSTVYLSGGSFSAPSLRTSLGGLASRTFFTIEGPGTVAQAEWLYINLSTDSMTTINLNDGGTLAAYMLNPYDITPSVAHPIVVNFDGGCLKRRTWSGRLVYQRPELVDFAVYGKGMTMDTTLYSATQTAETPFVGHVAGGVQSVDASAAVAKNWIGAPQVIVSGDGYGASAVADWDFKARKLKGIKITSHGWGYTQGAVTVTVRTVQQTVSISGANVTVGDNDIGGFTLVGANTFTLNATNSWQKWTRVNGGTLTVGSNGAIPSGTELIMNGGKLDLNGFDADTERPTTFSGLSGTGGTVVNGAVKIVGEWRISASNIIERTSTALTGALDLSGVTGITITDADALEAAEGLKIFKGTFFTATSMIWPQNLEINGLPLGWHASKTTDGCGLRLVRKRGFTFIVF